MSNILLQGPHQGQPVLMAAKPLTEATAAMILLHGRGATAENILELAQDLPHAEMAYLAPQAAQHTWYPYSFLAPIAHNEPWLSSALHLLADLLARVEAAGIPTERIVVGGFSQGACLASEFVARNARRYGGLLAFSGGVIGPLGAPRVAEGGLLGTPAFLGCSDVDPHIPLARVQETADLFTQMGGQVTMKVYPQMGHTIIADEIEQARQIVARL